MLTIGLFVSKLGTVLGPQKKTPGIIPANVALAVSVVAVIAVIAPVRDGTCFRAYADGTVEHNGDGERAGSFAPAQRARELGRSEAAPRGAPAQRARGELCCAELRARFAGAGAGELCCAKLRD